MNKAAEGSLQSAGLAQPPAASLSPGSSRGRGKVPFRSSMRVGSVLAVLPDKLSPLCWGTWVTLVCSEWGRNPDVLHTTLVGIDFCCLLMGKQGVKRE